MSVVCYYSKVDGLSCCFNAQEHRLPFHFRLKPYKNLQRHLLTFSLGHFSFYDIF